MFIQISLVSGRQAFFVVTDFNNDFGAFCAVLPDRGWLSLGSDSFLVQNIEAISEITEEEYNKKMGINEIKGSLEAKPKKRKVEK